MTGAPYRVEREHPDAWFRPALAVLAWRFDPAAEPPDWVRGLVAEGRVQFGERKVGVRARRTNGQFGQYSPAGAWVVFDPANARVITINDAAFRGAFRRPPVASHDRRGRG